MSHRRGDGNSMHLVSIGPRKKKKKGSIKDQMKQSERYNSYMLREKFGKSSIDT